MNEQVARIIDWDFGGWYRDDSVEVRKPYAVDDLLMWLDENLPSRHSYWLRRSWIPEGIGWEVGVEFAPDNQGNRCYIQMTLLEALEDAVLGVALSGAPQVRVVDD